jgi:hypothetical protein
MDLIAFKEKVNIIHKEIADRLRKRYISAFINTEMEHYREYILTLKQCSDGLCYFGYLWDCLRNPIIIGEDDIFAFLSNYSDNIYILWDIHSKDKIWIENYWKFDKNAILELDPQLLLENLEYLPEDIYIFDSSFEWTYVLTHEEEKGVRVCAKAVARSHIHLIVS